MIEAHRLLVGWCRTIEDILKTYLAETFATVHKSRGGI